MQSTDSSREVSPVVKRDKKIKSEIPRDVFEIIEFIAVLFLSLIVPTFGFFYYWRFVKEKPTLSRLSLLLSCIPASIVIYYRAVELKSTHKAMTESVESIKDLFARIMK